MPPSRREFVKGAAAALAAAALPGCRTAPPVPSTARIRLGYAAITWGGADRQAIDDISALGYPGIQLRSGAVAQFGADPAGLRALLAARRLTFVALSSGNLSVDPARESAMLAQHGANARFLRDAGGLYLQIIDERPAGRAVAAEDCVRLGDLLSRLGRQARDVGVRLVYHPHMGSIGERPEDAERVLAASDPASVQLLLDVAHWQQGGGDPVDAIRRHHARLGLLHLKDVTPAPTPGHPEGYRFVELGQGRVDLPAVLDALREVRYGGWAVVELDSVAGTARTPAEAAADNKRYLESHGLTLG
jgi:inosose dehydratase